MAERIELWKLSVFRGALALLAGIVLVAWPDIVLAVALVVYGAYSIALGVVDGGALLFGKARPPQRGLMLLLAALNIGVGALLVTAPKRTAAVVFAVVGVAIIIQGFVRLVRTARDWQGGFAGWVMLALAVTEVLIGVAFALEPLMAGVAFVAILGGLLLTYGVVGVGAGLAARASGNGGGPTAAA